MLVSQRQGDKKFKITVGHIGSSRLAWDTGDLVSKREGAVREFKTSLGY